MKSNSGYISVTLLLLLFFFSALLLGVSSFLIFSYGSEKKLEENINLKEEFRKEAAAVLGQLQADETPDLDSSQDEVWKYLESLDTPFELTLEDASSRINPNFVQKAVFENTELEDRLFQDGSADELQELRVDIEFSLDYEPYAKFFKKQDYDAYFSPYGFANINVTDEFALEKLVFLRTGSGPAALEIHSKVREKLMALEIVTAKEVKEFLGSYYTDLFPVINAEPIWNVHFLPELILEQIIRYKAFKIKNSDDVIAWILTTREQGEITQQELRQRLGVKENHRILQYLGVQTWFWRLSVAEDNKIFRVILARMPQKDDNGKVIYTVVQEKFEF